MSIQTYVSYSAALNAPYQTFYHSQNSITTTAGRTFSNWLVAPGAGLIPSTSVTCDRTTIGALGQQNTVSASLGQFLPQSSGVGVNGQHITIIDRLNHMGGLSGQQSASAVTVNSAATTRYTGSFVGVWAALEVFVAIGATAVLVSGSYTNQDGQSGRSFVATNIGAAAFDQLSRFIILPLQSGDTGVQSVQNIVLSNTTAAVGNFGVVLFKPITSFAMPNIGNYSFMYDGVLTNGGQMGQIQNNACLQTVICAGTNTTGVTNLVQKFIEV